jgi:peroxiredoxin
VKIIKIAEEIPDIAFRFKEGPKWVTQSTHQSFAKKRIILLGVPGAFLSDFPSTMVSGYEHSFQKFRDLGIDEIYCTAVHDYDVMKNWFKSDAIKNIKIFPDGNADWAQKTGFLVDMSDSNMGHRSHRYVMIIDNLRVKKVFYEDFTHDPHTCFVNCSAERVLQDLTKNQTTWERFS